MRQKNDRHTDNNYLGRICSASLKTWFEHTVYCICSILLNFIWCVLYVPSPLFNLTYNVFSVLFKNVYNILPFVCILNLFSVAGKKSIPVITDLA